MKSRCKYYVVQDALYLNDFADCLNLLAEKENLEVSRKDSQHLKAFAKGSQEAELSLHNSFFKEWKISAEGVSQMPHTLLYTSFMKRIVATRPYAEGLAALLPCFWVYMHVGGCMLRLRDELSDRYVCERRNHCTYDASHFMVSSPLENSQSVQRPAQFDAWIDMYGGEEFEREVRDYIAMVDTACKAADTETLKEMESHFLMCCKLEHMFWDRSTMHMQHIYTLTSCLPLPVRRT